MRRESQAAAWNGVKPDEPAAKDHLPPILPWFTFHEGRHSRATWLAEHGVPEVARRARLGHKMRGMARAYDHMTPTMEQQICDVLEARWAGSLLALTSVERARLVAWLPHLRETLDELKAESQSRGGSHSPKSISQISPKMA